MKSFDSLREIIARLRDPEKGCPWDRVQTHESLTPYLVEECYEVIDAIERTDPALSSELGDLLLQIMLHAQIGEERGSFSIEDVVEGISEKMVRRHPHVFGDRNAETVDDVKRTWEEMKASEKEGGEKPLLDEIPSSFPALLEASEIGRKVAKVGFDWPTTAELTEKVEEELNEFLDAPEGERSEEELGDLLFTLAQLARKRNASPEQLLKAANRKFRRRFGELERQVNDPAACSREQLEAAWQTVKSEEK